MHPSLRLLIIAIIVVHAAAATAQIIPSGGKTVEVPVFRSPQDSMRLVALDQAFKNCQQQQPPDNACIDTLLTQRKKIAQEAILRYRKIYYPAKGYFPFDSLRFCKDLSAIRYITINNRKLRKVPRQILKCTNLQSLEIVNCSIRKIQNKVNTLDCLKTLIVRNNKSAKPLVLKKNNHIVTLEIHGDRPHALPESYASFDSLKKIDLSENNLAEFPEGTYNNKNLVELDLQHNNITLEKNIQHPHPHLRRLALQYNSIRTVPPAIQQFNNLERLNFNHNKITDIAPEISTLKKLQFLSLYNNLLTSVPWGLYEIKTLVAIDLYFNQIEKLEERIANWAQLEVLYISNNKLLSLPSAIGSITTLEELYAYNNRITTIPDTLGNLSHLKVLRIDHNYIKTLPDALLRLGRMEELDLSHNYLTDLPTALFDFKDIHILALVGNPWSEAAQKIMAAKVPALEARQVYVLISKTP